mmetsp:Transcript_3564/g.8133  ORF Transcript_3564/g.8133 Transcript_3564/m.8133 type:complete len:410 (-) Transcript_3564:1228-2457(-)
MRQMEHPSFVVPVIPVPVPIIMSDKENDHYHLGMTPVTPSTKPTRKLAMTTGKARTKVDTSLFRQKTNRVPLSSKTNHLNAMNPFGACNVSLQRDYTSVHAVDGSASKTAHRDYHDDDDDHHHSVDSHQHHVLLGGPISRLDRSRITPTACTPHSKAVTRTPQLHSKRLGVDGTYQTPSRELLRSTACSRGHELHHVIHNDNHIPVAPVTTGDKKKKTRGKFGHRLHAHIDNEHQHLDDITLRIPHVTFRGQENDFDNTFDADLADDVSALSIHLDCPPAATPGNDGKCIFGDTTFGTDVGDDESIDRSLLEALGKQSSLVNGEQRKDNVRDFVHNPVATTLHIEDFLMQEAENNDQLLKSSLKESELRDYIVPLLPVFTKTRGLPSVVRVPVQGANKDIVRPTAVMAT